MSYLVLARKWRPQNFEQIVGQEHVTTTLRNAIRTKRTAHAYIFAGARGVGKTTTARILAKALNCAQGPTETPCNQCTSCLEITGSRSMDVLEIDGASNRGIDQIRDLRENVKYTPTQGKYKVYIIDEVHMLTKEAFNALLKTLEEPPAHVVFVFATTEVHKVPITILSRCQRFDFRRIQLNQIVSHLKKMLSGEEVKAEDECLYIVAKKAEGSMRDSISLMDQLIAFSGNSIKADDARQVLGLVDEEMYFKALELVRAHDKPGILSLIDQVAVGGYDLQEFILGWLAHLRKLLLIAAGSGRTAAGEMTPDEQEKFTQQAQGLDDRDILRMANILIDAEATMKRSSQARLILEMACLRLCNLDSTVRLEEVIKLLDQGGDDPEKEEPPAPALKPPQQAKLNVSPIKEEPAEYTAPPQPLSRDFESLWQSLITAVQERHMTAGTCLASARPVGVSDGNLILSFGPQANFHKKSLEDKAYQELIQEETFKLWGQKLKVVCQVEKGQASQTPQVKETPQRLSRQDEIDRRKSEVMESPQLKSFMDAVDGEVV
ncbi:MAG: DNA polymerase III, subunit gamma and tau [Candidatus Edwardsbacteria bacterium RifOxyA12_full_54_48]|uniref:DNA polymerase III subunit gamma/tau n=1 Tax=Candidatus Edwardsbacteria bacterium GWF2_54_11 TaxID=1817851 RepID=A0A1F5RFY4_9BACT|nr:MAG: DNA polymerase III, subunit gamma and tau [Candidatus Edwardsbacteria bacterium RifOxyC12_full_54_24]OGF06892.1 MAG: DNA polymerase III, subunit gamma and tau [Candidatus Edwardsbacteria bacterium RifOxyA12_full_54_48]OGF10842.1 MAG: DNA polymerase III, subunit gamma and tau [Candidatus Edwardsbacteria bacterium GWE2_54_12]OGF13224.1 MAG: DNA polymerase III, subunit gamma and tau [Candidatus Edwardsbacteria bacterium GWF2_54_11]OGJ18589.1 MAG: DNA polymerase III, subunit gamma and tau [